MRGVDSHWPDGSRRCDGVTVTEGRRCYNTATHALAGDVAELRYCKVHAREQATVNRTVAVAC